MNSELMSFLLSLKFFFSAVNMKMLSLSVTLSMFSCSTSVASGKTVEFRGNVIL